MFPAGCRANGCWRVFGCGRSAGLCFAGGCFSAIAISAHIFIQKPQTRRRGTGTHNGVALRNRHLHSVQRADCRGCCTDDRSRNAKRDLPGRWVYEDRCLVAGRNFGGAEWPNRILAGTTIRQITAGSEQKNIIRLRATSRRIPIAQPTCHKKYDTALRFAGPPHDILYSLPIQRKAASPPRRGRAPRSCRRFRPLSVLLRPCGCAQRLPG